MNGIVRAVESRADHSEQLVLIARWIEDEKCLSIPIAYRGRSTLNAVGIARRLSSAVGHYFVKARSQFTLRRAYDPG
jgi:hypothetical protein